MCVLAWYAWYVHEMYDDVPALCPSKRRGLTFVWPLWVGKGDYR